MAEDYLELYLANFASQPDRHGRVIAPATLRATRSDLAGFIAWWEHAKQLSFNPALVLDSDLRDWQRQRQTCVKNATINRALTSLRSFFAWATDTQQIVYNPTTKLADLPIEEIAPRSVPADGVTWLIRVAAAQADPRLRLRDLALLTLLSDCGLRSQEAADVQIRDLDLAGASLIVRSGKRGMPGRVPLTQQAIRRLRDYLSDRCPDGLPTVGAPAEREPLLWGRLPRASRTWTPGMTTSAIRYRLIALRDTAVSKIKEQATKETNLERIGALHDLSRRLAEASPHQLRHGLAYRLRQSGKDLGYIQKILRHTRASTTLMYGIPTADDLRGAMEDADVAAEPTRPTHNRAEPDQTIAARSKSQRRRK